MPKTSKLLIIRTAPLLYISLIEKEIKNLYPTGVCLNTYKILGMLTEKHNQINVYNRLSKYVNSMVASFHEKNYSPVTLIGGFTAEELYQFTFAEKESLVTISLFSSDEQILNRQLNRVKHLHLNSNELLTRYKNKRTLQLYGKLAYEINKTIHDTRTLSDFAIDISKTKPPHFFNEFFSFLRNPL